MTKRKRGCIHKSPLKAPSQILDIDIPLTNSLFPAYMSVKHNGMMGIAMVNERGNPVWHSYNMEPISMAPYIKDMFSSILKDAQDKEVVFVGEFNSSTMNKAGKTISILAGTIPMPDDFAFKCFYEIPYSVWNGVKEAKMGDLLPKNVSDNPKYEVVIQYLVENIDEFKIEIEHMRNSNIEGFMLLNPEALWKMGRATVKENIILKYKYYSDPIDAKILDITARKQLKRGLSHNRNPAGRIKKLNGVNNYEDTEIGGTILCRTEDEEIVEVPFPVGTSLELRGMYYRNKGNENDFDILGKWLSFRQLSIEDGKGSIAIKDVEFRDSKD